MSTCACMGGPNCCRRKGEYQSMSPDLWRDLTKTPLRPFNEWLEVVRAAPIIEEDKDSPDPEFVW